MSSTIQRTIRLIVRPTRYEQLLARHHTAEQARFVLERLGDDFDDYEAEHRTYTRALGSAREQLGALARVHVVARELLPNLVLGADDVIVVLGQDGLVANTLKYVGEHPVIGVNPEPARFDGKLLPFRVGDVGAVAASGLSAGFRTRAVTLAKATLSDGQTLYAVNDFFVGLSGHGSARYALRWNGTEEAQSSSGIIVSTGLGSTGWLRSVLTGATRIAGSGGAIDTLRDDGLPWDARELVFSVREPFPSKVTGTTVVFGRIGAAPLAITSRMTDSGVIFSDGIEADRIDFHAGLVAEIGLAERQGRLVH
jgi:NAD kinase